MQLLVLLVIPEYTFVCLSVYLFVYLDISVIYMSVSKFCCCQLVGIPSAFLFALRSRCLSLLVALHQINLVTVYHSSSVQRISRLVTGVRLS